MANHPVDGTRTKLRVRHYVAVLEDFDVPFSEYSEERGDKIVRLKAKTLSVFFWSRRDVVDAYHTYEDPVEDPVVEDPVVEDNTEDSFSSTDSFFTEEEDDDDSGFDSDEWDPDALLNRMNPQKRSRE